ncbi:hypothetical protein M422DRAFT_152285 [Sphaerobolus stellatus SS14]|nr:hypothetical protein M422DRAFT_152285 [Sphaerobolus stellatus SS14]
MSATLQETAPTITTSSDPDSLNPHTANKYPHTRAILAQISNSIKHLDPDSLDVDVDGDDVQRISPAIVSRVVALLQEENEEELKDYLREAFSIPDTVVNDHIIELMHKHRDDINGVPFLFLTPTKRPTSRPSSRASQHSYRLAPNRPDTPNSLPGSPLAPAFRRPHTPVTSPLAGVPGGNSYMTPGPIASASSSPLSSPRLLNAKAVEFRPTPRPLSAAGSNSSPLMTTGGRTDTPSPDLWAHNATRATSNLAIAAPLVPESTYVPGSGSLTPTSSHVRTSNLDEDYEDEFDPFSNKRVTPLSFPGPSSSDPEPWSTSSNSTSSRSTFGTSSTRTDGDEFPYNYQDYLSTEYDYTMQDYANQGEGMDDQAELLTDGMTPFDVLSSVFGPSVSPADLNEALEVNGYDFESAMAWLVDKSLPQQQLLQSQQPQSPQPPQQQQPPQMPAPRAQSMGGRVVVVPREAAFSMRGRGFVPGPAGPGRGGPRYGARPVQGANRVCRYFLAGECMRADCRFSHDLERALCRFWLRGNCAKQENCEFLHQIPKDVDLSTLNAAMAGTRIDSRDGSPASTPPPDEFPTLASAGRGRGYAPRYHDPSRNRFAAAVKAQPNPMIPTRFGSPQRREFNRSNSNGVPVPRPSPRIKLRSPTLLPTLPTGESVNKLYMSYRQRALQLGAARNACLSRAADAWRRGDGAAAKRFSREGHELNAKMGGEAAEAAGRVVKERVRLAAEAVRGRDLGWSDEARDRSERGRVIGAGLGVVLGVASRDVGAESGGVKMSPEERMEALLDLHWLHANEAVEVLERFLVSLEKEAFFGLVYIVVGEEKHTGSQDPARGSSRARLAAGVREWLHDWGYPWSERDGVICVDPLTHA